MVKMTIDPMIGTITSDKTYLYRKSRVSPERWKDCQEFGRMIRATADKLHLCINGMSRFLDVHQQTGYYWYWGFSMPRGEKLDKITDICLDVLGDDWE